MIDDELIEESKFRPNPITAAELLIAKVRRQAEEDEEHRALMREFKKFKVHK